MNTVELRGGGEDGDATEGIEEIPIDSIRGSNIKFAENAKYFGMSGNEIAALPLDLHERMELLQEIRSTNTGHSDGESGGDDGNQGSNRSAADDSNADSLPSRSSSSRVKEWVRRESPLLFAEHLGGANVTDSDDSCEVSSPAAAETKAKARSDGRGDPAGGEGGGGAVGKGGAGGKGKGGTDAGTGDAGGRRRRRRKHRRTPPPEDTNEALDRAAHWPGYTCRGGEWRLGRGGEALK